MSYLFSHAGKPHRLSSSYRKQRSERKQPHRSALPTSAAWLSLL